MADALSTRHIKYSLLITVDYRSKNNEKTLYRKCMASYICVLGNDITGQFALIFLVMNSYFSFFPLNIESIRSVTKYPPTTLIVANMRAAKPNHLEKLSLV